MTQTHSLSQAQFLLIASGLLQRAVLARPRTEAKRLYRALADGRAVALPGVALDAQATLRFALALDASEFRGSLNFSAFRDSLQSLLAAMGAALRSERPVTEFAGEGGAGVIFGLPAVTDHAGQRNVLVLGRAPQARGAPVLLRLMYLDPDQFAPRPAATA